MPGATTPSAAAAVMRLEPLTFVGYERLHSNGVVHLVTPQGGHVRLHPSPPAEQIAAAGGATSTAAAAPPPSARPPTRASPAAPSLPKTGAERPTASATDVPAAPPDDFAVEFLSSSSFSSRSASSVTSSRASSPPPATTAADGDDGGDAAAAAEATAALSSPRGSDSHTVAILSHADHGTVLTASASASELEAELTRCALLLFGGKLPQQQQQQPPPAPAPERETPPPRWSEAVNYSRVVVLGYDDAGLVYLDAQAFAQPVPPPQRWRLCPLPILVCSAALLGQLFDYAAPEVQEAGAITTNGTAATAHDAADGELRYPVMPRPVAAVPGGGDGGPRASLPPPRPVPTSGMPPPPPPPPRSAPTSTPLVYLSPPLRWRHPACGSAPPLDLRRLFDVQPHRVYRLAHPPEEVVFLGAAFGVPWVRPVVPAAAATATAAALLPRGSPSSQPPAGYSWKDPRGWAEPLTGCHDARDIRHRHGLVDDAPAAAAAVVDASSTGADGEAVADEAPAAAGGATQALEDRPTPPPSPSALNVPSHSTSGAASLPPPPPLPLPLPPPAPTFVKEGNSVFVPGRFGVMLECSARPALLEAQFGVVYGDRLVSRASPPHAGAAALMVLGAHGRHGLVLLGDGPGQSATQVHVERGAAEVAELFRKVEGASLPPPALPLEPLTPPATPTEPPTLPAADSNMCVADTGGLDVSAMRQPRPALVLSEPQEEKGDPAMPLPNAATIIFDGDAAATAQRGEHVESGVDGAVTCVGTDETTSDAAAADAGPGVVAAGDGNDLPLAAPAEVPQDGDVPALAATASAAADSEAGLLEVVPASLTERSSSAAPCAFSSGASSQLEVMQPPPVDSDQAGQTPAAEALASRASPANTPMPEPALHPREAPEMGSGGLVEVDCGPIADGVPSGRRTDASASDDGSSVDEAAPATAAPPPPSAPRPPPLAGVMAMVEGETGHPQQQPHHRSASATLPSSLDHTPSLLPTPSASMPHVSVRPPLDSAQDTSLVAATPVARGCVDTVGVADGLCSDSPPLPPPSPSAAAAAVRPPHEPLQESGDLLSSSVAATPAHAETTNATPRSSSESPAAVMPASYGPPVEAAPPPEAAPPSPPPYASVTPLSYSPPPTGPAGGRTAPRATACQVTSYPASTSPPWAAVGLPYGSVASTATAATPTPFTNFLKAYAIYSAAADDAETRRRAGQHGRGLDSMLDFYRARPLARITEATARQRRCRAAWAVAAGFRPTTATATADVERGLQVRKLLASASATTFDDLCVDELVSLLALVG
ncbi:hypothetical protein NESM_000307600 [Novymonas esmeraldas]|uniref:Uncharacterized protein n=1 Tax=Novymonas esmeraldas TaxID=1808958 RepID=A0AAW0EK39_9TRYP